MARKRPQEEHENHERWLVSYADFITLLFAFFVVMYAISSVNEGKYRVLSDALVAAFREAPRSMEPVQLGEMARSPYHVDIAPQRSPTALDIQLIAPESQVQDATVLKESIDRMAREIEQSMASLIEDDLIDVRQFDDRLEVEIKTSILFRSGSSRASGQSEPVLRRLADVLIAGPNNIVVEGFTDNRPIRTIAFPSNWELSSARAATVVRLFVEFGVPPERLAAVGYGEFRPVADNTSAEGRAKNRRVVLVILAGGSKDRSERNLPGEVDPSPEAAPATPSRGAS